MPTNNLFANPGIYHIQFLGSPSQTLMDNLGSFQIKFRTNANQKFTDLIGNLPDQVALIGVLRALHELHYAITSVKVIEKYDKEITNKKNSSEIL